MVFDASHRMLGIVETPSDFTVQQIVNITASRLARREVTGARNRPLPDTVKGVSPIHARPARMARRLARSASHQATVVILSSPVRIVPCASEC